MFHALSPHELVVSLCERSRRDLSMVPPDGALCPDDIWSINIDRFVNLGGLGKVVSSTGDLRDGLGVTGEEGSATRCDNEKAIGSQGFERGVTVLPDPF